MGETFRGPVSTLSMSTGAGQSLTNMTQTLQMPERFKVIKFYYIYYHIFFFSLGLSSTSTTVAVVAVVQTTAVALNNKGEASINVQTLKISVLAKKLNIYWRYLTNWLAMPIIQPFLNENL